MSSILGNQKKSQSQMHTLALTQESTAEKSSVTTNPAFTDRVALPFIKSSTTPANSVVQGGGSVMHQVISSGSFNSFSKGAEPMKLQPEPSKHKIRVMPRGSHPYNYPSKAESLKSIAPVVALQKSPHVKVFNSANFVSVPDDAYALQAKQFGIKDTSLERSESKVPSPFYAPSVGLSDPPTVGSVPHTPIKSVGTKHRKQRHTDVFEQIVRGESGAKGFHTARHSQNKPLDSSPNMNQTPNAKANLAANKGRDIAKSSFFRTMIEQSVEELPVTPKHEGVFSVRRGSREVLQKAPIVKSGMQLKVISSLVERQKQQAMGGVTSRFPLLRDTDSNRPDPSTVPAVNSTITKPSTLADLGSATPSKEIRVRGPADSLPKNLATTLSRFKVMPANKRNWGLMSENRSTLLQRGDGELPGQTAN